MSTTETVPFAAPAPFTARELEECTRGYCDALIWSGSLLSDLDTGDEPDDRSAMDHGYTFEDIDAASVAAVRGICAAFLREQGEDVLAWCDHLLVNLRDLTTMEFVGHTLYLTAAGFGVSFDDRESRAKIVGERLTRAVWNISPTNARAAYPGENVHPWIEGETVCFDGLQMLDADRFPPMSAPSFEEVN